jgi:hypothetical protein
MRESAQTLIQRLSRRVGDTFKVPSSPSAWQFVQLHLNSVVLQLAAVAAKEESVLAGNCTVQLGRIQEGLTLTLLLSYDLANTNIGMLGTDLEKAVRQAAAETEDAVRSGTQPLCLKRLLTVLL